MFATEMRAGEAEGLSQEIGEMDARLDLRIARRAVDSERDAA
jgi:hypothetical protein